MTFFTRTGRHRVQISYFFRMQIGTQTPSGTSLGSGGPLGRMRMFLGLFRELWIENLGILCHSYSAGDASYLPILADVSYAGSGRACGVGDCTCIVSTLGDLGETSGPRIDRIQPARTPWRRRQHRELKKLLFSPPSTCPIDLFGPLANRTIL